MLRFTKAIFTYDILLILILVGGFFGQCIYIGFSQLHLVRIMFPILILWGFKNLSFKTTNLGFSVMLYYIILFITTTFMSFVYRDVTTINDYINFIVASFLPIFLLLLAQINISRFIKIMFYVTLFSFIIYVIIAIYEVLTLNHLSSSLLANVPKEEWWRHVPTGVYANQNDFASAIALMGFLLISYLRLFVNKNTLLYELFILLIITWIALITTARLVQVVLLMITLVLYFKYIFRLKILICVGVICVILMVVFYDYFQYIIDFLKQFNSFEKGSPERVELFTYGLKSVKESWGMGFGIGNSDIYYSRHGFDILIPHFYQIEVLMTGGILPLLVWIVMYLRFFRDIVLFTPNKELILFPFVYFLLQQSAASIFFNYTFYIIFIAFVAIYEIQKSEYFNK